MAIGRSFHEALQKAIRMLNIGAHGISDYPYLIEDPIKEVREATDRRLFALYAFFQKGGSLEEAHRASQIDLWFLAQICDIVALENKLSSSTLDVSLLLEAKQFGFSDKTIAKLTGKEEEEIRTFRKQNGLLPSIKQIDTLAGEFDAQTNYLYLTYHAHTSDLTPSLVPPIIVLGSGPYSIGSSVEFDWCAVNTSKTLRGLKKETIIINSNPETVSTDYDESDRLYFEELTLERVQDIIEFENPEGIIVSVGGQIANNLALPLFKAGYPILGTSPLSIDRAEDRKKFSTLLSELKIDQPSWSSVTALQEAKKFAREVGFPILIRPSYVLSGSAMNIVYSEQELEKYLKIASLISQEHPVVLSQFISEAKELEVDGVAREGEIVISALSEHIENAGVHSGDATIVLPPQKLYLETIRRTKNITKEIVKALEITGPFNIQFIAKNNSIQVIECNLRASRSFPFVSKVTGHNFIAIATEAMLGIDIKRSYETLELDWVGVKTPQFSYNRLKGANPVAHVEMASTGEVACLGVDFFEAFLKSWLATEQSIKGKRLLVSIGGDKKLKLLEHLFILESQGWELFSTEGTHDFLSRHGIASRCVFKASERHEPNISTLLKNKKVDLIINIPRASMTNIRTDGFTIRRLAIDHHIPLITNLQIAEAFLSSFNKYNIEKIPVRSMAECIDHAKY